MIEERPVGEVGFWGRIARFLVAMIHSLAVVAVIHYLWLIFGSSVSAGTAPSNPDGELENVDDITSAGNGSTFKVRLVARPLFPLFSDSVNALIDSGAPEDYFDDALIPGYWEELANRQMLNEPRKITTAGRHQLGMVARELLYSNIVHGDGSQR